MRNNIKTLLGAVLLTLAVSSCHEESDTVLSYVGQNNLSFEGADKSFAGKYRVFWNALNTNYAMWDYEKECGLDWDEHYKQWLPKFEALDKESSVGNEDLRELMREMLSPLHDGHMYVEFSNHLTGDKVGAKPSDMRIANREDYSKTANFLPNLEGYEEELYEHSFASTRLQDQVEVMTRTEEIGYDWAITRIKELQQKENPTQAEAKELSGLFDFIGEVNKLKDTYTINEDYITKYNQMVAKYSYLDIPFLEPLDKVFLENGIYVNYGLFNDGIAYLYISSFSLTPYLVSDIFTASFPETNRRSYDLATQVRDVWSSWFRAVQVLHKSGQLRGVIIDVRNNGGGMLYDSNFLLGALLPSGGLQYGWARFKRGVGRYDYSPMMPMELYTLSSEHEIINDVPVVVLANSHSVSMAEATSLGVKQMPNGCLIGKRTYGGLCALTPESEFSTNYTTHIGQRGKTPVYCYLPNMAMFDMDNKVLDGVGVEPDIDVDIDKIDFVFEGKDSQLDRALEYIRSGK